MNKQPTSIRITDAGSGTREWDANDAIDSLPLPELIDCYKLLDS